MNPQLPGASLALGPFTQMAPSAALKRSFVHPTRAIHRQGSSCGDAYYACFRTSQISTETANQAAVAAMSTIHVLWRGINCQTSRAKTKSPLLPIAAPAASILAASLPRCVPRNPSFSFFCFSCFSISVALAGKIAGNAKNSPPMPGPNFLAMMPAKAVISPPKRNRTAYSYHFVCPRTERSTLICITISARDTRVQKLPQAT